MGNYDGYPLIPETETDGFVFGTITPLGGVRGAGFLQGPDGARAGIQWEVSDGPFIERVSGPDGLGWGVYRVGFPLPVSGAADVVANLSLLLPRLKVLYGRARGSFYHGLH